MLERDGRFQIESVRVTTDLAWEIVTSFLFHVFRFEQNTVRMPINRTELHSSNALRSEVSLCS